MTTGEHEASRATRADRPSPASTVGQFDPLRTLSDAHRLAIATADSTFRFFARFLPSDDGDSRAESGHESARSASGVIRDDLGVADEVVEDDLGFADLRRGVTRSLDLYLEMAERLFDASTRSLERTLRSRGVTVTGSELETGSGPLRVEGRPGGSFSAPIWLHNLTDEPLNGVSYLTTDLVSQDGEVLRRESIVVTPEWSDPVAAGTTATASVQIDVPPDALSGTYVGHVLLSSVPDAVLPIRLHINDDRG